MLSAEELSGDNQYHCEFCGGKVDATRQLCLRQLPPYLCLSLQRFVFDMKVQMHSPPSPVVSLQDSPLKACSTAPYRQHPDLLLGMSCQCLHTAVDLGSLSTSSFC